MAAREAAPHSLLEYVQEFLIDERANLRKLAKLDEATELPSADSLGMPLEVKTFHVCSKLVDIDQWDLDMCSTRIQHQTTLLCQAMQSAIRQALCRS